MATKSKKKTQATAMSLGEFGRDDHIQKDYWWLLLIRGLVLLGLGVMAIAWPGVTLLVLAWIFAFYLIAAGVVDVVIGVRTVHISHAWFLKVLLGIAELALGVYLISNGTIVTLATFVLLIGLSFILQGAVEIVGSLKHSHDVGNKFWSIFGGILSLVVGVVVLRQPVAGGLAFAWVLGFYGLLAGALSIAVSLSLRTQGKAVKA